MSIDGESIEKEHTDELDLKQSSTDNTKLTAEFEAAQHTVNNAEQTVNSKSRQSSTDNVESEQSEYNSCQNDGTQDLRENTVDANEVDSDVKTKNEETEVLPDEASLSNQEAGITKSSVPKCAERITDLNQKVAKNNNMNISDGSSTSSAEYKAEQATGSLESNLKNFLKWCKDNELKLSPKVNVSYVGTSHRYGMVATKTIKKGETLFIVPRTILLHSDNGTIADRIINYEEWLDAMDRSLDDSSGWVPLLLTLMFEYNNNNSFWAPYMRLVPPTKELGHPLFWKTEDQVVNLQGMSLFYDIQRDIINIEHEYKQYVVPFICRNKDICPNPTAYSLELYKRMVAFVMAYSFTEELGSPTMIPMADILNHHSDNNAHLVFERDCLKMKSFQKINKGDEIYNTFGKLGNSALLQMYGYVEPNNQFDALPVAVMSFFDLFETSRKLSPSYLQAMIALLNKTSIAQSDDYFIFDKNGMRNGPDLIHMLKVLHMSETDFEEMLKARAGNRPDSFYKKLLRKLKLAKKTDVSTGVAVIDITEEEVECEQETEKRKFVELQEIEDTDEQYNKRMNIMENNHCQHDGAEILQGRLLQCQMMEHMMARHSATDQSISSHIGNTKSSAIVIDDDDSDEEFEKIKTDHVRENESVVVDNDEKEFLVSKDEVRDTKNENINSDTLQNNACTDNESLPKTSCMDTDTSTNDICMNAPTISNNSCIDNDILPNNSCTGTGNLLSGSCIDTNILPNDTCKNTSEQCSTTVDKNDNPPKNNRFLNDSQNKLSVASSVNKLSVALNPIEESGPKSAKAEINPQNVESDVIDVGEKHSDIVNEPNDDNVMSDNNVKLFTLSDRTDEQPKKKTNSLLDEVNSVSSEKENGVIIDRKIETCEIIPEAVTACEPARESRSSEMNGAIDTSSNVDKSSETSDITKSSETSDITKDIKANSNSSNKKSINVIDSDHEDNEENLFDANEDSDSDEIEFLSEDIACKKSYEKLNEELLPEWKETLKKVLEKQMASLNATNFGITTEKDAMSRDQLNAFEVRRGQRSILVAFMAALT